MVGRTLSHYKILEEISRGGMGIVYRAVDIKLNREVALKVLPPELVSDPERKRRFVQEAQAASALEHPHIAVIHEIDEADGVTFIAMELIRGKKLRDFLQRERTPVARSLELATEVAEGLSRAHDKGIVHRDLKPGNIMVSEDGHAKIIDFGLAKLVEPLGGEGSEVETALRRETDPGKVMGTVSYMSPEQARGQEVDHRSDIFSLGIVLHEMLGGQPPFQGPTEADTLNGILSKAAPRLPVLGSEVSGEATSEIQRIVDKCLAKGVAERYQTMKDLVVDLRAVWRRLESGSVAPVVRPARRKLWPFVGAAAASVLLLVGALMLLLQRPSRQEAPVPGSKPSIAVLLFDNISDDPSLEWLRLGLAEMLVTDLSQSTQIQVLSTDRLYQILSEMNRLDERVTSLEVVHEVAERAKTGTVILGSFMKAGDTIRINIRVQDVASGEILTTEKVEGVGESSIFPMVDDLTRRIKTNLDVPRAAESELDRDLEDVTTSSPDAYRYYAEATNLYRRGKNEEAILLYEKAVEHDTGFASALLGLSLTHWELAHWKETDDYARRALEHVDRVTPLERLYIEGSYYTNREETFDRGIAAYEKAVELYPDRADLRNELAWAYGVLERYDEAIEILEPLMQAGGRGSMPDLYPYDNLANSYAALGQPEKGYQVLQDFLRRSPDSYGGHLSLGNYLTRWGKLDEALEAVRKAESLRPGDRGLHFARFVISALRGRWDQAEEEARELAASSDPAWRWEGFMYRARTELYRGRSGEGLALIEEAARAYRESWLQTGLARSYAAHLLLEKGQAALALEQAQEALSQGKGDLPEWEGLFFAALAQARLGRWEEAEKTAEALRGKAESLPTEKEKRRYHHLAGELALARSDTARAIEELTQAQSMLPARGGGGGGPPVPIWFSLASACLAAGDEGKAAEWFKRITESTTEHIWWPIPYVRSFYFLGKIHENRGEMDKAREYYQRFVDFWKDGDVDRERIEEAMSKLT